MRAVTAAIAVVSLSSCMTSGGGTLEPLPPPPSTVAPPSTTIAPDFSQVPLPGVRGSTTTTTISLGPGAAAFRGTVTGPDGPVAGAPVRVERLVGSAVASMDVASQPDGNWELPGIRGGAYRVRAWRPPDLAQVAPAFVFIGMKETFKLDLKLDRYAGPVATAAVAPNPPVVEAPVNLVVQLSSRTVDDQGFVTSVPLFGARATLASATGTWLVASANPTLSDTNGRARWDVRCRAAGSQPLTVTVDGGLAPLPLTLPPCVEPATTAAPAPASSAPPSSSPATLLPRPTTTTTTTTRPATTTTTRPAPATTTTRPAPATTRPR
ncbi:MAG TPA: carboxypeptidase-like regulatory domain-containing protein [Acidimicrobiales bacterium]|nr:carboxypeptidase-like regulatory domain-containing protein [Acidimicrobiales bacterium]